MIIYVVSKAFPKRTFVCRLTEYETVARIRAQILHYLYELNREDHQFRLRFKGQYLRDSYSIIDYDIPPSGIVRMIPLAKKNESYADLRSLNSLDSPESGHLQDIRDALKREIDMFNQRENLIKHFLSIQYVLFLTACLGFLTTRWYSGFWSLALVYFAAEWCPRFTRFGGFVGKNSIHKNAFCYIYGISAIFVAVVSILLGTLEWTRIIRDGCENWVFDGNCTHDKVFSAFYFIIEAICLFVSCMLVFVLLWNMKIEYGDFVEKLLVQNRNIEEVMKQAKNGNIREKRTAAFELATLSSTNDDNKFNIVANEGLEVLTRLALSKDESTQDQSVEAISELLTIPSIQESFVESGGIMTLSALLRCANPRLVGNAASALENIVSEKDEYKLSFVERQGLQDLSYAAKRGTISTQRTISGLVLELSIQPVVRAKMTSCHQLLEALEELVQSTDSQIQRYALQTLELLAMENNEKVCCRNDRLLNLLLEIPSKTMDENVYLSTVRILLYYAENPSTCEMMLSHKNFKGSISAFGRTKDAGIQKLTIRIIHYTFDLPHLKEQAQIIRIDDVLKLIKKRSAEREVWDMADQALQYLYDESSNLSNIPAMSSKEKVDRMHRSDLGSLYSIRSRQSIGDISPSTSY